MGRGRRRQGVDDVVAPGDGQAHRDALLRQLQGESDAGSGLGQRRGVNRGRGIETVKKPVDAVGYRKPGDPLVVGVDDGRTAGRQGREEFTLGSRHPVESLQLFEVSGADVGDDADGRSGDFGQPGDLSAGAHSHLQHGPVILRGQPAEGQGEADQVVEVSLGGHPRPGLHQDGAEHVLGGGLAGRAGHRDDRPGESPPHPGRQIAEGDQGIGDADHRHGESGDDVLAQAGRGAALHRLGQKVMAVEVGAAQGHEEIARADRPAVGGHAANRGPGGRREDPPSGHGGDLPDLKLHCPLPLSRSAAASSSRSSKWYFWRPMIW